MYDFLCIAIIFDFKCRERIAPPPAPPVCYSRKCRFQPPAIDRRVIVPDRRPLPRGRHRERVMLP